MPHHACKLNSFNIAYPSGFWSMVVVKIPLKILGPGARSGLPPKSIGFFYGPYATFLPNFVKIAWVVFV